MYFDFEDRYEDYQPIGGNVRRWDGVALSIGVHIAIILFVLFGPALTFLFPNQTRAEELLRVEPPRERTQFVFVQPRLDTPHRPQSGEASPRGERGADRARQLARAHGSRSRRTRCRKRAGA
jgi:hypothetical protein